MSWISRFVLLGLVSMGLCAAHAQEVSSTAREQELLGKLDAVMKRLDVLEQELATLKSQQQMPSATTATEAMASGEPPLPR